MSCAMACEEDWLLAGYGLSAVLLMLYFLCEGGMCHRSQTTESVYLSVVLLLVYVASTFWGSASTEVDGVKSIYRLRQLMRLMLFFHILRFYVFPRAHPEFYSKDSARGPAKRWAPAPGKYARHKAQELEDLMMEVLEVSSEKEVFSSLAGHYLAPALFLILMLEDVMWAHIDLMQAMEIPLLVLVVWMHLYGCWRAANRLRNWSLCRSAIHDLIVDLLDRKASSVLQHVLANISIGTLVELASWSTVEELISRALADDLLCTASKAILISALQMKGLRWKSRVRAAVCDLILSCSGSELTMLKNLIDGSGTYHNLYKLIYTDISNPTCRQEILAHLIREGTKSRMEQGRAVGVKVLSDVDDTLLSSGGKFPAGCERHFPKHVVYPGYLRLVQALDRGWTPEQPTCNLVFLSARPHLYKDVTEEKSFRLFQGLVDAGRMHCFPTLLPGRMKPGLFAMSTFTCLRAKAWQWVGDVKYTTYLRFRDLYREYDYMFLGDNGQGDLFAGQQMLAEQRQRRGVDCSERLSDSCNSHGSECKFRSSVFQLPDEESTNSSIGAESAANFWIHATGTCSSCSSSSINVPGMPPRASCQSLAGPNDFPRLLCVLIRQVQPEQRSLRYKLQPCAGKDEEQGLLLLHQTYVGAALDLHRRMPSLVSVHDLARISEVAVEEFDAARWAMERWGARWLPAERALRRDLEEAAKALQAASLPPPPALRTLGELVEAEGWKRGRSGFLRGSGGGGWPRRAAKLSKVSSSTSSSSEDASIGPAVAP